MALSKENADFIVDMSCVCEVIETYDLMIKELTERTQNMQAKYLLLSKSEWSGEGRESFNQKMSEWKKEMDKILKQLKKTRECQNYLLEKADELRKDAEKLKSLMISSMGL